MLLFPSQILHTLVWDRTLASAMTWLSHFQNKAVWIISFMCVYVYIYVCVVRIYQWRPRASGRRPASKCCMCCTNYTEQTNIIWGNVEFWGHVDHQISEIISKEAEYLSLFLHSLWFQQTNIRSLQPKVLLQDVTVEWVKFLLRILKISVSILHPDSVYDIIYFEFARSFKVNYYRDISPN